jgi:hypothetical protein
MKAFMSNADEELRAIARAQHGVVGDREAAGSGLDSRRLRTRLDRGELQVVGRRALIIGGAPLTDRARALAAVLDLRGVAYLSHTSAAWLWGIPGFELDPIHVSRRFEGTRRPSQLVDFIHNLRGVPDEHLGEVEGIPVGSPVLTCFQVAAATGSLLRTERTVDNTLALGLARLPAFHALLEKLAERGRNGIRIMRQILGERPIGYRPPESSNEARFRWLCRRHGIEVDTQVNIGDDDHFVTRIDFRDVQFPELVYRIQSARWHGAVSHARDDARQLEALQRRFHVVDVWDRDLWNNPDRVVADVLAARRAAATRRLVAKGHSVGWK